jgi:hypothetical protein
MLTEKHQDNRNDITLLTIDTVIPYIITRMTRTNKFRMKGGDTPGMKRDSVARRMPEQDETMGQQDNTSITPLIGTAPTHQGSAMQLYNESLAVAESFVIPPPVRNDDDNISVLTDCSWMMEEEEDASSQVAASVASESWTVVTTATDSTTIPTHNSRHADKRRHVVSVAYDNGPFKRRRKL